MRPRGSALLMSLLLLTLLLVLGLGFLGRRAGQYRASALGARTAEARALAEAGFSDAHLKLERDFDFPPRGAFDQTSFVYSEELADLDGTILGHYEVTIDNSRRKAPYYLVQVVSVGVLGPPDAPLGRAAVRAEVDVCPSLRGDPTTPNPDYFRVINWQELSGL